LNTTYGVVAALILLSVAEATLGPAWTYDNEVEKPADEKDMGGWNMGVYTQEQQTRLNVNELGEKVAPQKSLSTNCTTDADCHLPCPHGEHNACIAEDEREPSACECRQKCACNDLPYKSRKSCCDQQSSVCRWEEASYPTRPQGLCVSNEIEQLQEPLVSGEPGDCSERYSAKICSKHVPTPSHPGKNKCEWCTNAAHKLCFSTASAKKLDKTWNCGTGPSPPPAPTPTPTPTPTPAGKHYEAPPCASDEQAVQVQGIKGAFCSPSCSTSKVCPAAPSSTHRGTTAQCILQTSGSSQPTNCALVCVPAKKGENAIFSKGKGRRCPAPAKCEAIQGTGLCMYPNSDKTTAEPMVLKPLAQTEDAWIQMN